MHDLHAQAFGEGFKAGFRQVKFRLLAAAFLYGPGKNSGGYKLGLTNHRGPEPVVTLVKGKGSTAYPPQPFQGGTTYS